MAKPVSSIHEDQPSRRPVRSALFKYASWPPITENREAPKGTFAVDGGIHLPFPGVEAKCLAEGDELSPSPSVISDENPLE